MRVTVEDGPSLSPTFICAGQTKQLIRLHTQTAVLKYLVLDKRPVILGYKALSYLSGIIHFLYRSWTEKFQTTVAFIISSFLVSQSQRIEFLISAVKNNSVFNK